MSTRDIPSPAEAFAIPYIEQKRDARDLGNALLKDNARLFNALDTARASEPDGTITVRDLEAFVAEYHKRFREGRPSDGIHTAENVAIVRDMLGQWSWGMNIKSPLAVLTGTVTTGQGQFMKGAIELEEVRKRIQL